MAPRRLSDNDKQDLVGRYKSGESTAALAHAFGCSPNTVTRTVKALLPAEAYAALKASRQRMPVAALAAEEMESPQREDPAPASESTLALEDADDFGGEGGDVDSVEDLVDADSEVDLSLIHISEPTRPY